MSSPDFDSFIPEDRIPRRDTGNKASYQISKRSKRSRKPREFKTYNYDPLPRKRGVIRLLSVYSSEKTDNGVLCELITPKEEDRSSYPYEALSWCWGTAAKTDYIRIQRNQKTYAKYVSPNLVAALKALRHKDQKRYLWVDMVCIDQDNLDEKNHQVEMMNIIYGNAERVCIWLGEANESSDMALRFIKKEVSHLQSFDTLCDSKDASKKWVALLDLMQRPWFSRRWVVQELALAQKAVIYCGRDKISWKKFAIAVELFVEVETATHRLSEVMKKDRQYQYIPSYFEFVSALGASLLVDATERLFRDHQGEPSIKLELDRQFEQDYTSSSDSDSDRSSEWSDSEESVLDDFTSLVVPNNTATGSKNRIQPLLSLEYLVSSLTIFDTTVPHDTIYALLAIAKDTTPRAVTANGSGASSQTQDGLELHQQRKSYNVDYNLPYVDVCKDFISFSVEQSLLTDRSRALDVICRPWAIEERKLRKMREEKQAVKEKQEREAKRKEEQSLRRESRHGKSATFRKDQDPKPTPNGASKGKGGKEVKAENEDMALPSWVPQLTGAPYAMAPRPGIVGPKMSRINADPLVGLPSQTQRNYSAAETKGVDMKVFRFRKRPSLNHFSMYVRGFVLDKVRTVQQVARNGQIPTEWAELGDWSGAKGHPPDAFWRTLVANRGKDGKNPPVYYSRACEESFKKGGLESGAVDTTALIDYERNSVVAQFCRRVQAVTWNRALAKTKTHRLALVGKDVDEGDLVCILYGCSVPVILRKSEKKDPKTCEAEMAEELKLVAKIVSQRYKQYVLRKKQHEFRKTQGMVPLCRQWLNWRQRNNETTWSTKDIETALNSNNKTILKTAVENLLKNARIEFSNWRRTQRKKLFDEYLRKIEEEEKEKNKKEEKSSHSKRQFSLAYPSSPITSTRAYKGFPIDVPKDGSSNTKKKQATIDWWDFEYALVAGKRWRKIVKTRKEERVKFAVGMSEGGWNERRKKEFEEFKKMRQREQGHVNDPKQTNTTKHVNDEQSNNQSKTRHEKRREETDVGAPAEKAPAARTPNDATSPNRHESTNGSKDAHIPCIRPCWIRKKVPREILTKEEGDKYYRKCIENLKERLGEDGEYSYKLLGECYIHGMMDGEAMLYQNRGNEGDGKVVRPVVFEIR